MTTAFQSDAFQESAFQVDVALGEVEVIPPTGAARSVKRRKVSKRVRRRSEIVEVPSPVLEGIAVPMADPIEVIDESLDDDKILMALMVRVLH